jgi:CheY-like chemotaxis protein
MPLLQPDIVIVDYLMPGISGVEFAKRLKSYPHIKIILATGLDQDYLASKIDYSQNIRVIDKGCTREELIKIVLEF